MSMATKICVIFNPAARGNKARHFRDHLATLSSQCALKPTYAPGAGRNLAAEAVREGFDLIVAAGGDGTMNEVLNGMADEPGGLDRVRLGVLPLGTVNVLATELKLPTRFTAAWEVIRRGQDTTIDLGEVEFAVNGQNQRRLFALLAGAGLDSRAIELVDWQHKQTIGRLAYLVAGLKALRGPNPQIVVSSNVESLGGELVLIGNGQLYGGKFRLFPEANMRDGLLEVTVFPHANWKTIARTGWGLLSNRLYSPGGALHLKADSLTLSCGLPVPWQVDGENVGPLPARFSVRRQALRVIVP